MSLLSACGGEGPIEFKSSLSVGVGRRAARAMAHHEHFDEAILRRRRRRRRPQKHIGRDVADRHWEKEGQVGPALQKEVELLLAVDEVLGLGRAKEGTRTVSRMECVGSQVGISVALNAAAAHSCDRPHRLKRCGDTMVSRIASSVWRAQSRVRAALACEAKRARVCVGVALAVFAVQ